MILKIGFLWFLLLVYCMYPADSLTVSFEKNSSISYGIETDFNTQYIWRGLSFNKGFIVQPSPWISFSNFTLSMWGNLPVNDINSADGNEIDFTAAYLYAFEDLSIEPSLNYYTYPDQEEAPSTAEGNLKAAYKIFESELYANLTLDILEYSGSFTSDFGIVHEISSNEKMNLVIDLNTGWGNKKFNQSYVNPDYMEGYLNYLSISVSSNYYLTNGIYIKPHIEHYRILSLVLKEVSGSSLFNFGFLVGAEF